MTQQLKAISESTSVTLGAAGGVIIAVFWAGMSIGRMQTIVDAVVADHATAEQTIAQHDRTLTDHAARLASHERLLEGRAVAAAK